MSFCQEAQNIAAGLCFTALACTMCKVYYASLKKDFSVIAEEFNYPDVEFNFVFKEKFTPEQREQLGNTMRTFMDTYNSAPADVPKIHFLDELIKVNAKTLKTFTDFGNCDPEVFENLVDVISKAGLNLKRLKIK